MPKILLCVIAVLLTACSDDGDQDPTESQYRQQMRDLVQAISTYARGIKPGFIVIPQNGHDLLTLGGEPEDSPATTYLAAIDGVGREDLYYGFDGDDKATPQAERERMIAFMDVAEQNNVQALVTNYCSTPANVDDSYQQCAKKNYACFAADHRGLDNVPAYPASPFDENQAHVTSLAAAKNFLYLLDTTAFADTAALVSAIGATNHDVVITDLFAGPDSTDELTASDVAALRTKAKGGKRLAIAYMSIGEAEDYRYYWKAEWKTSPPAWLAEENPDWPGNYKVQYWDTSWQQIIFGNDTSYLKRIIDAGFDGVYLDIIDAFEYFEDKL